MVLYSILYALLYAHHSLMYFDSHVFRCILFSIIIQFISSSLTTMAERVVGSIEERVVGVLGE